MTKSLRLINTHTPTGTSSSSANAKKRWSRSIDYDAIAVRLEASLRMVASRDAALGVGRAVTEEELADLELRLTKAVNDVAKAMAAQRPSAETEEVQSRPCGTHCSDNT